MSLQLKDEERAILMKVAIRPRTIKGYYKAKVLLALDKGLTPDEIAKKYRLKKQRVENLSNRFVTNRAEILSGFLTAVRPSPREEDFERDLDYVLEKNRELYRRLAQ